MEILQLHFMWSCAGLCRLMNSQDEVSNSDVLNNELSRVLGLRDGVFRFLSEYAIDPNCNACEEIKRAVSPVINFFSRNNNQLTFFSQAFVHLLNAYLLCYGSVMPKDLKMDCDEQTQYRCAGFMAAEIERFANETKRAVKRARSRSEEENPFQKQVVTGKRKTKNGISDLEVDVMRK